MKNKSSLQEFLNVVRGNETLIKGYASRKCKECLGRGVVEMTLPEEEPAVYVCSCTIKNAKKGFLESE